MDTFDFFISHASADKASFVRPLAAALSQRGYKVWFDELSIRPGESIRQSIDAGMARASAGVVVLSKTFFERPWPQAELDALVSLHVSKRKLIIPIWLGLEYDSVAAISPILADKKAIRAPAPLWELIAQIESALPERRISDPEIDEILSLYVGNTKAGVGFALHRSMSRLCSIAHFGSGYWQALEVAESDDEETFETRMATWRADTFTAYEIPKDVYTDEPQPVSVRETRCSDRLAAERGHQAAFCAGG